MNVENQPETMAGNGMGIALSLEYNDEDKTVHVKGSFNTMASTQALQQLRMRIRLEATSCVRKTATRNCFRMATGTGW